MKYFRSLKRPSLRQATTGTLLPLFAGVMLNPAQAAPFDPGHYPDSTKVLLHVDFEKPLLKDCVLTLDEILPEEIGVDQLAELGLKARVLDFSACVFDDKQGALQGSVLVRTDGQMDGLMAALSLLIPDKQMHGNYSIYQWQGGELGNWWFTLHPVKRIFVCSDQLPSVKLTLDAMDDKKNLKLGKLPVDQLKAASALLSSLDLGLGQQEVNELLKEGSELLNLADKMALSVHTEENGTLKLKLNLQGNNPEDAKMASRIGDGMLAYLTQQLRHHIPFETQTKLKGDSIEFEAKTDVKKLHEKGKEYLQQVEIPEEYGEFLKELGKKLQALGEDISGPNEE